MARAADISVRGNSCGQGPPRSCRPAFDPKAVRLALSITCEHMALLLGANTERIDLMERTACLSGDPGTDQRFRELSWVVVLGRTVYSEWAFRLFLVLPQARFDGQTALDLIEGGLAERVIRALCSDLANEEPFRCA